ncbi:unnamed protein product [Rhizophagus irregularis]|nr:unnamed protein product [Rhizophagus irregularis]
MLDYNSRGVRLSDPEYYNILPSHNACWHYRDKGFTDSTFREHKPPYDMEYTDDYDTPEIWWSTCRQPDNFIQELGRISLFW